MSSLDAQIRETLRAWDEAGLRRTLTQVDGVDFCTNDYLGLARDPAVTAAVVEAVQTFGAGSRAARLLGGHLSIHEDLEREAALWLGTESALLLPSGWHANVALLSTLPADDDVILSDAHNHASLIDGMRLSRAAVRPFAHNDMTALARALRQSSRFARRWIVVESVYSMNGSLAPLDAILALAEEHDATVLVDEAHSVGLYGEAGQGRCPLHARIGARVITGGKALGASGALIGGSQPLVDLLVNRARPFVFTTSPPPAVVAALRAAIRAVQRRPELRAQVHEAAAFLRARLRGDSGTRHTTTSPIVFVPCASPQEAVRAASAIQQAGFQVRAVRPPTVPDGQSGLRIVVHANHDREKLEALAAAVRNATTLTTQASSRHSDPAKPWVVVGTDTDAGKTVVSAILCRALARAGKSMRYWKAVQTGTVLDTETVSDLAQLSETQVIAPAVHLALPASVDQAAEAEDTHVSMADLVATIQTQLTSRPGTDVVIETAGGVLVPYNDTEDQRDLIRAIAGEVLLVARSGLGTLNHTRLTVEALRRVGVTVRALFLVGPPHARNVKTLGTWLRGIEIVEVPHFDTLSSQSIDTWLDEHDLLPLFEDNPAR